MGELLHKLVETVGEHQHLAYMLVLLLSFSESLPLLGALIPGTTIIVAIAAFVPSGAIDIWWLLAAAVIGAILGDGFSYWLGHRYHREITAIWPLSRYPQLIEAGQAAVHRHGGMSIFIARFTPAVRAIVPLVAGILRMDPWRFYMVNVVSAVAWAIAHIVPAVIAGASLAVAGHVGGRLLVLILIVGAILYVMVMLLRLVLRKGLPLVGRGALKLWYWARLHDNWVGREILSLLDPTHGELKGLLLLVALLAVGAWAIFGGLAEVAAAEPLERMDQAVLNFLEGTRSLWADRAMVALTELGDAAVTASVATAVLAWLALRGAWRAAAYWLGTVAVACLFVEGMALLLELPRPTPNTLPAAGLTLASSHTAVAASVYGMLGLLIGRELAPRWRLPLAIPLALLVFLVAFSRLYLGVRWTSDVVVGLVFAACWIAGLGLVYLNHRPRRIGAGGLAAVALFAFVIAGGYHAQAAFDADLTRYAARPTASHMAATDWWRDGWRHLPPRRIDLSGALEEPLTLQWAGRLSELKALLEAQGWVEPPPWSFASALAWLETGADLSDLPVLTRLHDGQPARLVMVHASERPGAPDARLILRLWRAPIEIDVADGRSYRLWLGSAVEQRLYHVGSFLTFGRAVRDENAPRTLLAAELYPSRLVQRAASADRWGWNGWVILAHDPALELPEPYP